MNKKFKKILIWTGTAIGLVGVGYALGNPQVRNCIVEKVKTGTTWTLGKIKKTDETEPREGIQKKPRYNNGGKYRNHNNGK